MTMVMSTFGNGFSGKMVYMSTSGKGFIEKTFSVSTFIDKYIILCVQLM